MDTHENAPLTPRGREMMVRAVVDYGLSEGGCCASVQHDAEDCRQWVERFEAEGVEGLRDRSSRPHSSPSQAAPAVARRSRLCEGSAILAIRSRPRSGFRRPPSAAFSSASASTALSALEPAEPVRRYERAAPGEIVHIDIKKLGKFNRIGHRVTGDRAGQSKTRGIGWEYVHLAIDHHCGSPIRKSCRTRSELLPALSLQRSALLSKPRRQGRARHDR